MRTFARLFKALADETRLKMLALLLKHEELCVCDFEKTLEISQSKASRHLRYMSDSGLLMDRRDGLWVFYRVDRKVNKDRHQLLEVLQVLLSRVDLTELEHRLTRWLAVKAALRGSCQQPPSRASGCRATRRVGHPRKVK